MLWSSFDYHQTEFRHQETLELSVSVLITGFVVAWWLSCVVLNSYLCILLNNFMSNLVGHDYSFSIRPPVPPPPPIPMSYPLSPQDMYKMCNTPHSLNVHWFNLAMNLLCSCTFNTIVVWNVHTCTQHSTLR